MSDIPKRVFGLSSKSRRVGRSRRPNRNSNRRNRRKKSKQRYYTNLKERRIKRHTDDLCTSLTVVDITDMEWTPFVPSSTEVAEWQKQEQIAYWKSRALSLEYENKMLVEHIRNVYAKQTEDYAFYAKEGRKKIKGKDVVEEAPVVVPEGKKTREEMENMYGEMSAKIMGTETLNYDTHAKNVEPLKED